MDTSQTAVKISTGDLREEVRKEYAEVALDPHRGYHFHTGRVAADRLGYDLSIYAGVPEENIASFAGTGNPFMLGPIEPGEIVVDVGSGSGFDSLIASTLVGPEGKVIGVDMTQEMLKKARAGAEADLLKAVNTAGFKDAAIVEKHDIFADVPNPSSAMKFGTLGISLRARKP